MPISVSCPHCLHEMKVPDSLGGQVSQCPMCRESMTIPVPPDSWWAESPSEKLGPLSPAALDQLVADGKLDATFQLRKQGESTWQPAAQVFPQLQPAPAPVPAAPPAPDVPPGAPAPPPPPPPPVEGEFPVEVNSVEEPPSAPTTEIGQFDLSDQSATAQVAMSTTRERHAQQRARNRRTMIVLGASAAVVLGGFGYWGIFYGEKWKQSEALKKRAYSRYVSFGTPSQIKKIVDAHHDSCFSEAYSPLTIDETKYFEMMDPILEKELNLIRINESNKGKGKKKAKSR